MNRRGELCQTEGCRRLYIAVSCTYWHFSLQIYDLITASSASKTCTDSGDIYSYFLKVALIALCVEHLLQVCLVFGRRF